MATGDPTLSPLTVTVPCDEGEVGGGRGGQHAGLQRDLHVDVVILTSRPRASLRAPLLLLRCPLSLQLLTFCSKVTVQGPRQVPIVFLEINIEIKCLLNFLQQLLLGKTLSNNNTYTALNPNKPQSNINLFVKQPQERNLQNRR